MPIYNPSAGGGGGGAGAFSGNVAAKNSAYVATTSDDVLLCSGTFTVTLYATSGNSGELLFIKNTGTGVITISGDSAGETLDGSVSQFLTTQNSSIQLVTDGSDWFII